MIGSIQQVTESNQVFASGAEAQPSKRASAPAWPRSRWPGRISRGLATLFLSFDASIKVLGLVPATQGTEQLGYPMTAVFAIGVVELVCVIASIVPRTAVLGAILITGFLGGAVATHVRVESPLFSHTLFPIYVATLLWAGLWLNDENLRRVFPIVRSK